MNWSNSRGTPARTPYSIVLAVSRAFWASEACAAAVYGSSKNSPCTEDFPLTPNSPYGKTKIPNGRSPCLLTSILLGAHLSGYLGEDPCRIPSNLMPYVQQVAAGRRPALTVLGNDYATIDGTGLFLKRFNWQW